MVLSQGMTCPKTCAQVVLQHGLILEKKAEEQNMTQLQ